MSQEFPIIDTASCAKTIGIDEVLVSEMLAELIAQIPQEQQKIAQCITNQQAETLCNTIHALHGAVTYCGVPRLKTKLAMAESSYRVGGANTAQTLLQQAPEILKELSMIQGAYEKLQTT